MSRPLIYSYLDYRVFLEEMFRFRKVCNTRFSYRWFSQRAGFSSPNFLQLVIKGKRNLSNTSVAKIAKGFGLKRREREYFENLVFMNQADSSEEKNHYYRKMLAISHNHTPRTLGKEQYDYFSKWYHPAIRELIVNGNGDFTPAEIASRLVPSISAKEAQSALNLLLKLQLIARDEKGRWIQTDRDITTGPEIKSLVVANYHRAMLGLAGDALDRHPANERDISSVTLNIPEEDLPKFKERIASFRRELLELAGGTKNPERVVQINIQLFPLTK